MFFRLLIAATTTLLICTAGYYYTYLRIFEPLFHGQHRFWLWVFLLLCLLTFFGFALIRILPHFIRKIVEVVMFTWMGWMFVYFLVSVFSIPVEIFFTFSELSDKNLSFILFLVGGIINLAAMFQALRPPSVVEVQIPVPSTVSKNIENISAVVLSDIHVSGLIGYRKMTALVEKVNALKPDIIFITGDLMDGSLRQLQKEIDPLRHLYAKEGVYYITGNHEYYSGPLNWKKHFEKVFGWNVLSNGSLMKEVQGVPFNILGVEDKHWLHYEKLPYRHDHRFHAAVEDLRQKRESLGDACLPIENCFNVMLAHQPKDARYLTPYPWVNLQISGHTHGGQIWPLKYMVIKDQKYNTGLYSIRQNQFIYVNQGTGFWGPPLRLGTTCEITLLSFRLG